MSNDTQDKKQEATPQKLRKLREQGQVPKSHDLVSAISFSAGFWALALLFPLIFHTLKAYLLKAFGLATNHQLSDAMMGSVLAEAKYILMQLFVPIGITMSIAGSLASTLQTGILFSWKLLAPDLKRVNPRNGFKALFSIKRAVELGKNLSKMAIVGWLAYDLMTDAFTDWPQTITLSLSGSTFYASKLLVEYMGKTTLMFIAIGIIDLWWSRSLFFREQRMSTYEVQQEQKQQEIDPHIRGQRNQIAHDILFSGGEPAIKAAHALITNPIHIAVAIRYDEAKDEAPKLVAKGAHRQAERMKHLARKHHVPIVANIPLARALHEVPLNHEIPEELFEATAEILAYVYQLASPGAPEPKTPP